MARHIKSDLLSASRLHFVFVAALAAQIIIYDAWQLLAPGAVLRRWVATLALLGAVTAIWYLAHGRRSDGLYRRLTWLLIAADVAFASFAVFNQRGMAARAVALYAVALATATILRSRTALLATALLSLGAYVIAAVSYFVLNFNEGYKVELYGEVGFYALILLLVAGLLAIGDKR